MLNILHEMRQATGEKLTIGLPDEVIQTFLLKDSRLGYAIKIAGDKFAELKKHYSQVLKGSEKDQIQFTQSHYINFYAEDAINPYVSISAKGPWIITTCGAVIYDTGGYGMLGAGHAPDSVIQSMCDEHVMANIMTPSFIQKKFSDKLLDEIGHRRDGEKRHPFSHFIVMNSGSEAMTVATRISDINAMKLTAHGGKHAGKKVKFLALKGSFHGRTERPAQASDSSRRSYEKHLASFKGLDNLVIIEPNNIEALRNAFRDAEGSGVFFEVMFMEPVMGEGNPGLAATPEFYQAARELTRSNGTMLVVDSIQAGIRTNGVLSITDYPGFEGLDGPDMESYSKALNAGQFPMSVLALSKNAASLYAKGIYGNTMTANPRALEVACTVLDNLTEGLRRNIVDRGQEFLKKLATLKHEFPDVITFVQGTGLIVSCEINSAIFDVVGLNGIETVMRKLGIGVIHGGTNSLRFTPVFDISSSEIDLVVDGLRKALKNAIRK